MKAIQLLRANPKIVKSLMKSRVRKDALLHLSKVYPNSCYPEEIVRATNSSRSHVIGALIGMGRRYSKSYSLSAMGLVEIEECDGHTYYKITEKGLKVADFLK